VKRLDALRALFESGFGFPPVAAMLHGASVFSAAELSAQLFCAALSLPYKRGHGCRENHDQSAD
jgi:hypothetical protein